MHVNGAFHSIEKSRVIKINNALVIVFTTTVMPMKLFEWNGNGG